MNVKLKHTVKIVSMLLALCCVFMCMTACGTDVKVKINDNGVITEADANTGMTIKEILDDAGIKLGEKDETEPKADAKLEDATEITVKRYAKVTVKNGKDEKTVELVGATVEDAVNKAGFTLDDGVLLDVDKKSYLKDGMVITLNSGIGVSLTVDGKTTQCKTHAETVKEFLDEQKVKLGKDDTVSPKPEEKIKEGLKVTVKRVEYKEEVRKETIEFTTEEQNNSSLNSGETQVTQEGSNGEKEVTYKVKYVDGKKDSEKKVSEKVTKEPVNKIVEIGTANNAQANQSNNNNNNNSNNSQSSAQGGKTVVSKQAVYDCDGSGHGYYTITYSDGSVEYEEF